MFALLLPPSHLYHYSNQPHLPLPRDFTKPQPVSTLMPCPAPPRPPCAPGLIIIHRVFLGPGAMLCNPQALPGPQSWSQGEQPGQQEAQATPSTTTEGWGQGPATQTSLPTLIQQQSCRGPLGSQATWGRCHLPQELSQHWALGSAAWGGCRSSPVLEPPCQEWPKSGLRPKMSLGKGGRRIENTDMNIPGKHGTEGPDAGGHKPQPAVASTASHGHCQRSHNARPIPNCVGSFLQPHPQPGC